MNKVIPADLPNRLHDQHLPSPLQSQSLGVIYTSQGASILDADYPAKGVNIPRRSTGMLQFDAVQQAADAGYRESLESLKHWLETRRR